MTKQLALSLVLGSAIAACGGDDGPNPCEGIDGTCVGIAAGTSAEDVDAIFNDAVDGSTIAFAAGTYAFTVDLSLTANGLTLVGAGMDQTILSFAGQVTGAQGILATGDDFTVRDLGIEDSTGDGLKIEGADHVTIERVRVEWTGGPSASNGAYGLYPVQCQHVLIDGAVVRGASDAGIYVGQSEDVIIRNSTAEENVAGIEIENTKRADVTGNLATHNTGGILVFNLPGLEVGNGTQTRVYDNMIVDNNTENFAPEGNIVGKVPAGTGLVALAANAVEFFDNTITGHIAAPIGVVSYLPISADPGDPNYDPYPTAIYVHDNTITGTADSPSGELGALLILAVSEYSATIVVPDLTWDGVVDPARSTAGVYPDELKICMKGNGDADFLNINFPTGNGGSNPPIADNDAAIVDCTHAPLPAVTL